jgi:hypothetical protein
MRVRTGRFEKLRYSLCLLFEARASVFITVRGRLGFTSPLPDHSTNVDV